MQPRSCCLFLICVTAGCGARTELSTEDPDLDATAAVDAEPRESCWSLPNCIEATITTPRGERIDYAATAEAFASMFTGIHLTTPAESGVALSVQLMQHAPIGETDLSLRLDHFVWVNLRTTTDSCTLRGRAELDPVDTTVGGTTESSFEGRTDCGDDGEFRVARGRFRVTVP